MGLVFCVYIKAIWRDVPESSEAERVHFPYMGEAVRATKRTGKNFAGKESQAVLQIVMHFC